DLGERRRDATLTDAAAMAVAVHAAEPMAGLPVLDAAALAALPTAGLASLAALRERGRWAGTDDIHDSLSALEAVAKQRTDGAEAAPFGLCHSEFHPTSIHIGAAGTHVLDFARAFTGPGLLDLASWPGTIEPPDPAGLRQLLTVYVAAGGPVEVFADRGGLPAERWAYGMHRLWVVAWYLAQQTTWIDDETEDPTYQQVVRRHLGEAAQCLT
ncbi:MAG: aminoglycoside phosphotransferase family protein, partial [Actinomycetes bacterium]